MIWHLKYMKSAQRSDPPAKSKRKGKIIPSQMEVAPLHCTVDITQKRRLFNNTKEIEKM